MLDWQQCHGSRFHGCLTNTSSRVILETLWAQHQDAMDAGMLMRYCSELIYFYGKSLPIFIQCLEDQRLQSVCCSHREILQWNVKEQHSWLQAYLTSLCLHCNTYGTKSAVIFFVLLCFFSLQNKEPPQSKEVGKRPI